VSMMGSVVELSLPMKGRTVMGLSGVVLSSSFMVVTSVVFTALVLVSGSEDEDIG